MKKNHSRACAQFILENHGEKENSKFQKKRQHPSSDGAIRWFWTSQQPWNPWFQWRMPSKFSLKMMSNPKFSTTTISHERGRKIFSDMKGLKTLIFTHFVRKPLEGKVNKKRESSESEKWGPSTSTLNAWPWR